MATKNTLSMALGLLGTLAAMPATPATAPVACEARSPEHTVALLELFTSEGCSSCPPADRWLSALQASGETGSTVVPLALHVDYWDYIGWKDVFAQPGFAARQREQAGAADVPVYTPQFFMQGRPYRPSNSAADFAGKLAAINARVPGADLALFLEQVADRRLSFTLTARLREEKAAGPVELLVALYENGLSSSVKAGENRGATLHHDFVVREWIGPIPMSANGRTERAMSVLLPGNRPPVNFGIAVFVQNPRTREVLQALSRKVCT